MGEQREPARRVKIVATLGSASARPDAVRALADAGVINVFRLNAAHLKPDGIRLLVDLVRGTEETAGCFLGVFANLTGPKRRAARRRH